MRIKMFAAAAAIAVTGVSANAGGLLDEQVAETIAPPPAAAEARGSLGLAVPAILALVLIGAASGGGGGT